MVKKYKPVAYTEYSDNGYDNSEYAACKMEQDPHGKWVALETYQNETARLNKQIARLKQTQKKLITMVNEGIHISDLIEMTSEDISNKYYEWVNK